MKPANAMRKVVLELLSNVPLQPYQRLTFEMSPYMPLYITLLGNIVYIAHNREEYREKGQPDDPGIAFWMDEGVWWPSYTEMLIGRGKKLLALDAPMNLPLGAASGSMGQEAAVSFANTWARNIREQGWLKHGVLTECEELTEQEAVQLRRNYFILENEMAEMQQSLSALPARILRVDGSTEPLGAEPLELAAMQAAVGGYIEIVRLSTDWIMVINEDGFEHLPVNWAAYARNKQTHGRNALPIYGDVIICRDGQVR